MPAPSRSARIIAKIGEFGLSDEMGGFEILKKNFIITFRYEILTFLSVGPFFEERERGPENLGQKLKF